MGIFRSLVLALGLAISISPRTAAAELDVVTTTTDLADFVRQVGGDLVSVTALCRGSQDPHYVQARPSYMVTVSRADLLVSVGLDLEIGWLPELIRGARNPDINPGQPGYLEASQAVAPIERRVIPFSRSEGDVHPDGNPHYWLDPDNAKLVVSLIADRLGQLDPDNAAQFRANRDAFNRQLDSAIVRWDAAMAPYSGTRIASYHRTFNYFVRRFDLESAGYIEERPGIPPAPSHLARLIRSMTQERVPIVLHENYFDQSHSEMVTSRTGASLLVLPTSVEGTSAATDYETLMDHIVNSFVAAMEAR